MTDWEGVAEAINWEAVSAMLAVASDASVLNPPFVFGPNIHEVDKPENLGESMRLWYNNVVRGELGDDALANTGYAFPFCRMVLVCSPMSPRALYVDVRDIAQAHTLAIQTSAAGGERFIISAGPYKWQDFG